PVEGATFGDARFFGATFESIAWFRMTTFNSRVAFVTTKFKDGVYFDEATFNSAVWFGATFDSFASFDRATFGGGVMFDGARFSDASGSLFFERSHVLSPDARFSLPTGWRLGPDGSGGYTVVRAENDGRT